MGSQIDPLVRSRNGGLHPKIVRRIIFVIFIFGIAGIIVSSIAENNYLAVTFGLFTTVGALCLLLTTAITSNEIPQPEQSTMASKEYDSLCEDLELQIGELVTAGSDEIVIRKLVGHAIEVGKFQHKDRKNV